MLVVPVGYWGRKSVPTLLGAAVLTFASLLGPALWQVRPMNGGEIGTSLVALAIGAAARRRVDVSRRSSR
jgi:hypothetical protein